jgi:hypothetical protein
MIDVILVLIMMTTPAAAFMGGRATAQDRPLAACLWLFSATPGAACLFTVLIGSIMLAGR